MMRGLFVAGVVGMAAVAAPAETFTVPIDQTQSSVTATLTLQGRSDSDTSPVTGSVHLNLATVYAPTQATGLDFDIRLTETLDFFISYGFGSNFTATVAGLRLYYATPGVPMGPVPVVAGAFSFIDAPTEMEGVLNYNATGLVCIALTGAGLPCSDADDLSTEPTQYIDFNATATTGPGRLVTIISNIDQTTPLDPANPSLGSLHVVGTIRGSVVVPVILGDANGDCSVDFSDITAVLSAYGNPGPLGDADNSGAVDFGDITAVLSAWGTSCG